MCQALCWVMLGPTAASNVGLPSGGDRYNPRYLRSGTSDEAGSGLTQAQGLWSLEEQRCEETRSIRSKDPKKSISQKA